jgi:hypothetical protein
MSPPYFERAPLDPEVPEPDDPMVPELPEALELLPGEPLEPDVSVARRSQPTTDKLNAASTSRIFEVFLSAFILVPFNRLEFVLQPGILFRKPSPVRFSASLTAMDLRNRTLMDHFTGDKFS